MKKVAMAAVVMIAMATAGCSSAKPDAGQEAVLVMKPWIFGSGGIDPTPVRTGLTWTALTTQAVYVWTVPVQAHVDFDDLFTQDGVPLDFNAAVQFRVTDSVKLVREFGADVDDKGNWGFFSRNLEQPFRMAVRDAVKKHGLNEMAITVAAASQVDAEVTTALEAEIKETGVPIHLIGVTLGRANPPDAIKHQRIATAEQEQRQKTEQQAKLAEDQRKAHEESRAAADNAYREAMHLSPEQFLQLENIKMLGGVCAGGKCTFINGAAVPTLDVHR